MMKITQPIDTLIKGMLGDLLPTGMAWARVGVIVLVVAAWMSFDFGSSISFKHATFLACLTFVAAFGPEAAYKAVNDRKFVAGAAIAIACVPTLVIEFYSHGGYTAGLRGNNLSEARVQNTKYDGAQEASKEEKTNLAIWKQQLSTLMEQNAWATTIKADALRTELSTLKDRIETEKLGGRGGRKAGCGKECESLQNQANDLARRITTAEQASDLNKRIEATQRVLDGKRDVASKTEHKSSPVAHQNASLAKWVSMVGYGSLKPSEMVEETAEQSANFMMALAGTGLPALTLFIAGLYRRPRSEDDDAAIPAVMATPAYVPYAPKPAAVAPHSTTHVTNVIADDGFGMQLHALARQYAAKLPKAA